MRRPDALLHAQFYAEDGKAWFADAYNLGWLHALLVPYAGYLVTLQRLAAGPALLVPLRMAPLVLNSLAILLVALPPCLLLARRSAAWGSLRFRAVLAGLYLVLPATWEMGYGVTNTQWVLALCALLILAPEPDTRPSVAEMILLLLFGLTGPFAFLLLPVPAYRSWRHGSKAALWQVCVLGAACCCQIVAMSLTLTGSRTAYPLGASLEGFLRSLVGNVYASTLIGSSGIALVQGREAAVIVGVVGCIGLAVQIYCVAKAPLPFRLLTLFAAALFLLALIFPRVESVDGTLWHTLLKSPGAHYWFLSEISFAWAIAWMAARESEIIRLSGRALLLLLCVGIVRDWNRPSIPDLSFSAQAARFAECPPGQVITIPINPAGWNMRLVKH